MWRASMDWEEWTKTGSIKQYGHRRQYFPTQGHAQGHLAALWSYHRKPNQPCVHEIGQMFRRSLQDVRAERGVDASSNHNLVMATLKLRLKRCPVQKNPTAHYNMDHVKDRGTVDRLRLSLTNRFQALQELYEDSIADLEAKWEHAKQMWTRTC